LRTKTTEFYDLRILSPFMSIPVYIHYHYQYVRLSDNI
jgi:hypothetical protein